MIYIRRCTMKNFGDDLNNPLVEKLSNQPVHSVNQKYPNIEKRTLYSIIGSTLQWADADTVVWGTGYMSPNSIVRANPKEILAVRGPNTRQQLINQGFDCPEVYGDPALLMPRFYNPTLEKKYKLSIIPHYIDKSSIPELSKKYPEAHFIDIQQDVYKFIDEVIQSEYIISSALHGCIIPYAYGIPYEHQKFSEKVLGKGFKFRDFEASKQYIDLDKLMEVCPFKIK